jgi:hypothetical protein
MLEERALPATLYIVPSSGVLDSTHFATFQDAYQAAQDNDVIQVEPGAAISSVGTVTGERNASGGAAGGISITIGGGYAPFIMASEMVEISGGTGVATNLHPEYRLVVRSRVDATGLNTLILDQPLTYDHSQGSGTENAAQVATFNQLAIRKPLTIQGDMGVLATITSPFEVQPGASGTVFQGVNFTNLAASLTLDAGVKQVTVRNSVLTSLLARGGAGAQGDLLSGNLFTLGASLYGDPAGSSAVQVLNNRFTGTANLLVFANNGAVIQGNSFTIPVSTDPTGIVVANSQNVQILNNTLSITASTSDEPTVAVLVQAETTTNPLEGTPNTSVRIANNVLSTGGLGTGLVLRNSGGATGIVDATVQGNDFHGNKVGVEIDGVNLGTTGIDLGGGDGQSLGGNNFRDFTAAGTSTGRFAIYRHGTNATRTTRAFNNLFNVADPNTVIKDGTHNTATGGAPNGTGLINVGTTQLTADQAYIQTLYNHFLGRTGSVPELIGWVGQLPSLGRTGVLNRIFRSTEGLGRVVDAFFLRYLQRSTDSAGRASFVIFLQQGHSEEELAIQLISSQEYYDRVRATYGGTDASFVQSLFNKIVGRNDSAADVAAIVSQLPALGGRAGLARALLGSSEYRAGVVRSYYTDLLHRPNLPADSEVNGWVNSGQDLLTIEFTFATTPEFYAQS